MIINAIISPMICSEDILGEYLIESTTFYSNMMMDIGINELSLLEEYGYINEAFNIKTIFEKFIEFWKKVGQAISNSFKKIINWIRRKINGKLISQMEDLADALKKRAGVHYYDIKIKHYDFDRECNSLLQTFSMFKQMIDELNSDNLDPRLNLTYMLKKLVHDPIKYINDYKDVSKPRNFGHTILIELYRDFGYCEGVEDFKKGIIKQYYEGYDENKVIETEISNFDYKNAKDFLKDLDIDKVQSDIYSIESKLKKIVKEIDEKYTDINKKVSSIDQELRNRSYTENQINDIKKAMNVFIRNCNLYNQYANEILNYTMVFISQIFKIIVRYTDYSKRVINLVEKQDNK